MSSIFWQFADGNISWNVRYLHQLPAVTVPEHATPIPLRGFRQVVVIGPTKKARRKRKP